jgi:hypothetical protein
MANNHPTNSDKEMPSYEDLIRRVVDIAKEIIEHPDATPKQVRQMQKLVKALENAMTNHPS